MENNQKPEVVVWILLYNEKNEVFLASARKRDKQCVCVWWRVEFGETLEQAAVREVMEETTVQLREENLEFLCHQQAVLHPNFPNRHFVFFDFLAKINSNTPITLNDELENPVWIEPKRALSNLRLTNSVRVFIKKFIEVKKL